MLSAREDQIAVLFVGENTVFTEFTQRCSARDDDSFTVETTMSADKGLEIISDRSPDCVVSACDVPDMGGVGFLEAVRAEYPELPFILSLGDGREDVASEALSAGVTDCFKTRPASEQSELLANRIRNVVLARRETQRAERQEELRYLMERTVPIGGFEIDVETGDISLTDGTGRILDSSEDTSHTLDDWIALFHPTDHSGIRQAIDSTREMGEETGGTWRYQHPDGEERLMDVRFTPETITGDTTMLQGTIRDVTDQRERKYELEQIETLFEQAQDGLFLIDVGEEFTVERVNPALEDAMGVSAERLSGQRIQDIFGEEGARMVANCRQCIEHREPLQYDEQLQIGEHVTEWETRIAPVVLDDTVEYIVGSTRDVTEQREREQELQAEQRFIRQALDALDDVFYVIDVDGRLQRWNAQVPEVTGYPESTLADLNAIDLFPEDEQDTVTEAIDTTVAEGTVTVEIDLLTADGRRIPYEFRATRLTDDDGTTTGIAGIGRDRTERRQRERRFQALVEESHDAITVIDENGQYQYQSPSAERMLGYDVEETIGETVWEYIHPDDRETVRGTFEEWLVNPEETADVVEYRARHANGSWRWMEARANNPADNPAIDGFVINSRDITERKERERELQRIQEAVEATAHAIYITGPDGEIEYVNPAFEEITGFAQDEVLGKTPRVLDSGEMPDSYFVDLWDTICSGEIWQEEIINRRKNGETYTAMQTVTPVIHDDEIHAFVAVQEDITERKEREEALKRRTQAIDDAPIGISISDPEQEDNPVIYVNDAFVDLTGYSRTDILGENCRFLQGEHTRPEPVAEMRNAIDAEVPVTVELRNYQEDGTEFWNRVEIAPVHDDTGELVNYIGFQQDVTNRKQTTRQLEKRERILRELHTATQEFYPPSDVSEIAEFLVEFISGAFDFRYVSVKPFDKNENHLQPAVRSSMSGDESGGLGPVEPGPNPIWRAYEQGDPQTFDVAQYFDTLPDTETPTNRGLAFPTGDFGVIVVSLPETGTTDDVDIDLIEVVAAHAESAFQRLHAVETYSDVTEQLATKRAEVGELTHIVDAIQSLHGRLAESDSRDTLEEMVCEKLVQNDRIDFAWIGRPKGDETNLPPSTWAGQESGYLNTVDSGSGGELLPAQRAARDHNLCSFSDIGANAIDQGWAKKALTAGFRSVLSVPLLHDGVLYGVLSVYSSVEGAFDQTYTDLVRNVGSLLVSYSVTLDTRYADSNETYTVLEFDLADPAYPFQELAAATDSRIQFDTVVETTETEMKLFITVLDGDPDAVRNQASSVSSITAVEWVGETTRQLTATVKKPFLASVVGRHGARLHHAVSDSDGTTCRVKLLGHASTRPVVDSLLSEYRDISLVAQRQEPQTDVVDVPQVQDVLTDRQFEVLQAAFYSGYYDTPKNATGEDLAAHFGISSAAVYKHLQAGQRQILEAIFERVDTS